MNCYRKAIAVAGIRGGSGKTLVSIGLIKALKLKGYSVAAFKKGPDYIDPAWLSLVTERQCYNLDTFLMSRDFIIDSFISRNSNAQFAVVEGNRGIFDGVDSEGTHSFAELIKLLKIPVILVVDCTKSSRTIAALIQGCVEFDRDLTISGVILNQVVGDRHRSVITESIEKYCGVPVIGCIPRINSKKFSERHLGLVPVFEHEDPIEIVRTIGRTVFESVDMDAVVNLAENYGVEPKNGAIRTGGAEKHDPPGMSKKQNSGRAKTSINVVKRKNPRIGIIRDSAFNFYYPENIEMLEDNGGDIVEIDSMGSGEIHDIDGLYIGGGFPETHAKALSKNVMLMKSLSDMVHRGMPVYAECGGLIYLSKAIYAENERYPMVGIFPFEFELSARPQGHGYTVLKVDTENPFFKKGAVIRGHEFRYSKIRGAPRVELKTAFSIQRGNGIIGGRDGIFYKNTFGTFSHTHAHTKDVTWPHSLVQLASG